jgi:hypothetical protein
LHGRHLSQQFVGGGPVGWLLGQAMLDQRAQFGGQLIQIRLAVDEPVGQLRTRPFAERPLACGGEREHRTEAEHVA